MSIDAIVLAGRENTGQLAMDSGEYLEANIDIAGKPMVSYILDALAAVPRVGRILLIGPRDGLSQYESDRVILVEPGQSLFENVRIGLGRVETEFALICASDIPLVTPKILEDLLDRCLASGADFCYPVSDRKDCDRMFPGVKRTYVTLKEGTYTGGNVFFVRKDVVENAWPMVEKMIAYRKKPVKMFGVLGVRLLLKFLLKKASVVELEDRVRDLLGLDPKGILGASPEIGVDVDKPSDLELCRRILAK
ncbi:MAG: NTP transferase domain-containing protein [Bacillota bacterium]